MIRKGKLSSLTKSRGVSMSAISKTLISDIKEATFIRDKHKKEANLNPIGTIQFPAKMPKYSLPNAFEN